MRCVQRGHWILAMICVGHVSGCSAEPIPDVAEMDLTLDKGWSLKVRADGSGMLGFGSSGGDFVKLPPGSMDLNDISSEMNDGLAVRRGPEHRVAVILRNTKGGIVTKYSVAESACRTIMLEALSKVPVDAPERPRINQILSEHPIAEK